MIFNSLGSNYDFKYVLRSIMGFGFSDFRRKLKGLLEKKFGGGVILFYKGRQAIEAALKIADLPKGSFVAINGFTCYVVYKAVKNVGLNVEYLDIDPKSLNFSPEALQTALRKNPSIKAVIVQNTLGNPCDIEGISAICKKNNIVLIEDLAHSPKGGYGDFIALSFSQDKIIDAVSGGALVIKNLKFKKNIRFKLKKIPPGWYLKDRLYPKLTFLIRRTYGLGVGKVFHYFLKKLCLLSTPMSQDVHEFYDLPGWHSAIALSYFGDIENDLKHREKIVKVYRKNLDKGMQLNGNFTIRFPILVENKQSLIKELEKYGIYISDTWYDAPIAPKKYLKLTDYKTQCPNSEKISSCLINLPTHKNISAEGAIFVSSKINQWLNTRRKK